MLSHTSPVINTEKEGGATISLTVFTGVTAKSYPKAIAFSYRKNQGKGFCVPYSLTQKPLFAQKIPKEWQIFFIYCIMM